VKRKKEETRRKRVWAARSVSRFSLGVSVLCEKGRFTPQRAPDPTLPPRHHTALDVGQPIRHAAARVVRFLWGGERWKTEHSRAVRRGEARQSGVLRRMRPAAPASLPSPPHSARHPYGWTGHTPHRNPEGGAARRQGRNTPRLPRCVLGKKKRARTHAPLFFFLPHEKKKNTRSFYPNGVLPGEYNGSYKAARCPITVPPCAQGNGAALYTSDEQVSGEGGLSLRGAAKRGGRCGARPRVVPARPRGFLFGARTPGAREHDPPHPRHRLGRRPVRRSGGWVAIGDRRGRAGAGRENASACAGTVCCSRGRCQRTREPLVALLPPHGAGALPRHDPPTSAGCRVPALLNRRG
jgi:hypothetical protein